MGRVIDGTNHSHTQRKEDIPVQNFPSTTKKVKKQQMDLAIVLTRLDTLEEYSTNALLDCGCTSSSIDHSFITKYRIPTYRLETPIPVGNADGTANAHGPITEYVVVVDGSEVSGSDTHPCAGCCCLVGEYL